MITLVFLRAPQAKQSARFFGTHEGYGKKIKIHSFIETKVKDFEKAILVEALSQRPRGFIKLTGPLFAEVSYQFKPLANFNKTQMDAIRSGKKLYKFTKPDLTDNLSKGLFDSLKGHFFEGDEQIAKFHAEKIYGIENKIILKLSQL